MLQSREQEVLQQLHHAFKERSKPLRNVERCFREALKDLNGTLEKAHRFLSAAGRGAIEHLTNRIEYFQHYVPALNVVADNLPHEAYQVQPVPVEDVLLKLRESAIMVICPIEALPQTPDWSSLEEDLQIVKIGMNALKAAPLSTGASINSDKPQFHPPAVVSQASECVAGMTVTARVLLNESSDVYYIRLLDDDEDNCFRPLNESLPDLGEVCRVLKFSFASHRGCHASVNPYPYFYSHTFLAEGIRTERFVEPTRTRISGGRFFCSRRALASSTYRRGQPPL